MELKFRKQHRVTGVQEYNLTGLINQKNAKHTVTKIILYAHRFSLSPRVYTSKSIEKNISRSAEEKCGCNRNKYQRIITQTFNPLKPELNPICYLLALLGAHYFLHVSRIRVKLSTFRLLMSYIYGAPILDVSKSHTTTQHSR